jgi:hypothetical protein
MVRWVNGEQHGSVQCKVMVQCSLHTPRACRGRAVRTSVEIFTHSPEKSGLRSVSAPDDPVGDNGKSSIMAYRLELELERLITRCLQNSSLIRRCWDDDATTPTPHTHMYNGHHQRGSGTIVREVRVDARCSQGLVCLARLDAATG